MEDPERTLAVLVSHLRWNPHASNPDILTVDPWNAGDITGVMHPQQSFSFVKRPEFK